MKCNLLLLNPVFVPFHARIPHFLASTDNLSVHKETVGDKQEWDSQLDYRTCLSLALLLDQSDDWRRLMRLMKMSSSEEGLASFNSPTKEVLTMYEVSMPSRHSIY